MRVACRQLCARRALGHEQCEDLLIRALISSSRQGMALARPWISRRRRRLLRAM
jgi:hypothetical protein